ncbi:hypothetical protein [Pseudoprimorskyibacter insulae]|uniref:Uncharacterized protein n=1 Tax=Pseudoprimorskyibacter insulae TaxID=1695997 RepID=A0A2R8AYX8_9RHOB|nr:hypothetical protein [Pseudoprimorskyibacter insulae]SPF81241.1 hypothetical protein PRI8871_03063 [Pseudoprimorskyibacter insulae]
MSAAILTAFAVTFLAGPAIFAALMRLEPGLFRLTALALLALLAGASGMGLRTHEASWLPVTPEVATLLLLWLSWVIAVALVAMALRWRITQARPRRTITVLGLLATTLPWFGLATARLMTT